MIRVRGVVSEIAAHGEFEVIEAFLEEELLKALKFWKWKPTILNGKVIRRYQSIQMDFKTDEKQTDAN